MADIREITDKLFETADKNESKTLDLLELKKLVSNLDIDISDKNFSKLVQLCDKNKDMKFTKAEFNQFVYTCSNAECEQFASMFFYAADRSQNGVLSASEFKINAQKLKVDLNSSDTEKIIESITKQGSVNEEQFIKIYLKIVK